MKAIMSAVLAGSMLLAVAANANDYWAEERYRAKMGRYTPAEEARRASVKQKADSSAAQECATQVCCRRASGSHSDRSAGVADKGHTCCD